ncbi:uncharacterized protein LOC110814188 [Carica papaya]|uniref:uncharacterized protein LOC110814188 n=1 Tax=Carica papaya TaxID=3649 RepID=UPI000B8CF9E8|nr:uncharacterized protein LOC110814188 [Carica papaya]XP_021897264.1 uncharacterized protein LOC110814188 [Carica papaya]XP_021897265.1 uncharacterized protein LOC110814188 [Carica papaya]
MPMGILKINHKLSGASSYCNQTSYPSNLKGTGMEDNLALGTESGDDCDDCALTDVNCELGMVDDQLCIIPYELYDLPHLRDILSLETWNLCLTEEERFLLSAYLPDMDQQTFFLTMSELLGGSDVFFGNPLDKFFRRLKGGFYPPKVACYRECLQFFQKRKYYHSLISYHDKMVQMFKDMGRVWDECEMKVGVTERLYMWSKNRKRRDVDLLDLNTVPTDGYILNEDVKSDAIVCLLSNKVKSMESKRPNNILPSLVPSCGARGVLKVKASKNSAFHNRTPKIFRDISEEGRTVAKGLLKVVPKGPAVRPMQPNVMPRRLQPISLVRTQGSEHFTSSPLPTSTYPGNVGGLIELPSLWQNVGGSKVHSIPEFPKCVLNHEELTLRSSGDVQSSTRKINREMDLFDDIDDSGKHKLFGGDERKGFNGEHWCKKLGTINKEFCPKSLEQCPFAIPYYQLEPHLHTIPKERISIHSRLPEVIPRISDIGSVPRERAISTSSFQINGQNDASIRKLDNLSSNHSESVRIKDEAVLPLTYKRRKGQLKLNCEDLSKSVTAGADLEPGNPKESNQQLSKAAKSVKVKFMGWKDALLDKGP